VTAVLRDGVTKRTEQRAVDVWPAVIEPRGLRGEAGWLASFDYCAVWMSATLSRTVMGGARRELGTGVGGSDCHHNRIGNNAVSIDFSKSWV
jgi:hypothetical protein